MLWIARLEIKWLRLNCSRSAVAVKRRLNWRGIFRIRMIHRTFWTHYQVQINDFFAAKSRHFQIAWQNWINFESFKSDRILPYFYDCKPHSIVVRTIHHFLLHNNQMLSAAKSCQSTFESRFTIAKIQYMYRHCNLRGYSCFQHWLFPT